MLICLSTKTRGCHISVHDRIAELEEENTKLRAGLGEFKNVEANLRKKLENLESLISQTPNFAAYQLIVDPDQSGAARGITYYTPNFQELTGIPNPEDHGSWFLNLHPDDISTVFKGQENALKEPHQFDVIIRKHHPVKNEWRWFHFLAYGIKDISGSLRYFNGIVFDITAYKQVEHNLLDYQKRLRSLSSRLQATEELERKKQPGYYMIIWVNF